MNKLIIDTLKPLNIPIQNLAYTGKETTYCTFQSYLIQPEQYADDVERITGYYIHLDIFSKGNFLAISDQAKELMRQAGFTRTYETELYEDDTKYFHKVLRFSYAKNNKE